MLQVVDIDDRRECRVVIRRRRACRMSDRRWSSCRHPSAAASRMRGVTEPVAVLLWLGDRRRLLRHPPELRRRRLQPDDDLRGASDPP